MQIRDVVFFYIINFLGTFHSYASQYSNIFIFMTVPNNIYQKQIKYHVFNAVTNSELTELVPVFTIRPAFLTSGKKSKHIIQKCLANMGAGITDVIGGLHDFLPPRSDRSDEFQKLCRWSTFKIISSDPNLHPRWPPSADIVLT
jgi:hypothetical protein